MISIRARGACARCCAAVLIAVVMAGAAAAFAGASAPAAGNAEQARAKFGQLTIRLATTIGRLRSERHRPGAHVDFRGLTGTMTRLMTAELRDLQPFPAVLGHPYAQTYSLLQCVDGNLALAQGSCRKYAQGRFGSTLGSPLVYVSGLVLAHLRTAKACAHSLGQRLRQRQPPWRAGCRW